MKLAKIFLNLKRLQEHKTNCEIAELHKSAVAKHAWTYDHCTKWNETNILVIDIHRFSRKMRESIEIEKHNTIDQEGKPLDSMWHALFNMQNEFHLSCVHTCQLIRITSLSLQ